MPRSIGILKVKINTKIFYQRVTREFLSITEISSLLWLRLRACPSHCYSTKNKLITTIGEGTSYD
nr:MAG TPA: hypothetical protein [Caudoviricetes sp.]